MNINIETAVLTVIITGMFQLVTWLLNKRFGKRLEESQIDLNNEQKKKMGAETIQSLTKSIDDLTASYAEVNEKYITTTNELTRVALESDDTKKKLQLVESELGVIREENIALKRKNVIFESAIFQLQKENYDLKEESKSQRNGIDMLISQLERIPLTPVWIPSHSTKKE